MRPPALPFVRASWNDPAELMRTLDLGARGVI
jgi:2-keto-3-deoxy-L-rhamnonate aldolase RhmA